MASRNGTVEKKEIGIAIGTDGTFSNTELVDGKLQLKVKTTNPLEYYQMGLWTSKVIDIGDSFKEYENIILTKSDEGTSYVDVYTRTSENGTTFSPYVKATGGVIASPKNRYIQIRLEFHAGAIVQEVAITNEDLIGNNQFTENATVSVQVDAVQLKHNYNFNMTQDSSWTGEGSLHRQQITRNEWLRIDRMDVK